MDLEERMPTTWIGQMVCPFCEKPKRFGIDRNGEGRTSRMMCRECGAVIVLERESGIGGRVESQIATNPDQPALPMGPTLEDIFGL